MREIFGSFLCSVTAPVFPRCAEAQVPARLEVSLGLSLQSDAKLTRGVQASPVGVSGGIELYRRQGSLDVRLTPFLHGRATVSYQQLITRVGETRFQVPIAIEFPLNQ